MNVDRRTVLGTLALLAVPGAARAALPAGGLAAVAVDTGRIAAAGLPAYAHRIAAVATPMAREALGPLVTGARGAPTLVLSLTSLQLAMDPGTSGRHGVDTGAMDWIEGDAVLVDPRGRELARRHILTTSQPQPGDRLDVVASENIRIGRAVALFARWAKSELAL